MKKSMIVFLGYLMIFAAIFAIATYDFMHNKAFISIGLSASITSLMLMLLSALAVLKTTWHIWTF